MTYKPALIASELFAAAAATRLAAEGTRERAEHAPFSAAVIADSGFRGPAFEVSAARFADYGSSLSASAERLEQASVALVAAAALQQQFDEAAQFIGMYSHSRVVLWLNGMSMMLDLRLSRTLLGASGKEQDYDPLFDHPDESFESLHARHAQTVPASTLRAVEDAGGVLLEAGPTASTVLVGDAVDPARVITMVAGATTGKPSQLPSELEKARMLSEKTGAAVVVWQGYAPPPLLTDAASPHRAHAGADDLAMFQAALEERFPDAQKTVVSHSYGTLLATKAAHQHGLLADDLWILGSAGVSGEHVSKLTLAGPEATVHVVDSPEDPILLLRSGPTAALGSSPSYIGWGGERVLGVRGDHTDYFTDPAFLSALQQRADPPA
ncbi:MULTISPECIES: alpha/beta hydrolase [unclassified Corynebacterium]|uniref:alpha/beta hydrolase n=1 Tax=unclassified Corynebacterium TaxID=2624378 RepID=UPI001EF3E51E|nr:MULTISPECIES: alpha/beta hydrolase [unclassified Corynebacterium]MCG7289379.1 alpha/beta hydrolase family protein [Corynebacterium sp. ACRPZ]MCG7293645.1 alpha/beta hydrolase family protein [Corynebacterium sp. ACRPY]